MPAPSDRKSRPPVGAHHYAPAMYGTIRSRAIHGVARAAGVSHTEARRIIGAKMPESL